MKITKRGYWIIGGLSVAGLAITFLLINNKRKNKMYKQINDTLDGKTSDSTYAVADLTKMPDAKFPLKIGSYGKQVAQVQLALNKKFGTNLDVDGKYGENLSDALCSNVFNLCTGVQLQARKYTLSQSDYDTIIKETKPTIWR